MLSLLNVTMGANGAGAKAPGIMQPSRVRKAGAGTRAGAREGHGRIWRWEGMGGHVRVGGHKST
eukprot:1153805-Pelagomonas_calceolata.AAC.5